RMDALIAAGSPELILVMPDCFTRFGGSQYVDSAATGRYETHLVDELVPWVDERWRTLAARDHRGIAGKSSGGFGALRLGLPHADVWERWLAFDPLRLLPAHAGALGSLRLLYLDCGTRDEFHLHHGARAFTAELRRLGIAHTYEEYADGHMNVSYRYDKS